MYFFYFVPIGLEVQSRRRAFVTWFIAALCVIVFIAYRYRPISSYWNLTNLIFQPGAPSLTRALSHAFLHVGWLHLAANLVYLLLFGRALESKIGALRFYLIFSISSAVGAYAHSLTLALFAPDLLGYGVVGASGAVSGVIGASLIRFYWSRIRLAYWIFMPLQGVNRAGNLSLPLAPAVFLWFLWQGVQAVVQFGSTGVQVAYGEHFGGLLVGMALAWAMGSASKAKAEKHYVAARSHFERAEWFAAEAEYIEYLSLDPSDFEARAELARTQICNGEPVLAAASYERAIALSMEYGLRDKAEGLFEEAIRNLPFFALDERMHLDMACGLERTLKYRCALAAYERFLQRYPASGDAPFVLLRMAGIQEKHLASPDEAMECYRRLTEKYPFDPWADYAREAIARAGTLRAG